MKKFATTILALGVLMTAGLRQATASPALRLSADGGLTWIVVTDNGPLDSNPNVGFVEYDGPIGGWSVSVDSGIGDPATGTTTTPKMDLSTDNISATPSTLIVQMSDNNFITFPNETFIGKVVASSDGSVTYKTYRDGGNVLFGTTSSYPTDPAGISPSPTAINLMNFGPFVGGTYISSNGVVVPFGTGPFSLTLETSIIHTGNQSTTTDARLFALAPPPCNCTLTFNAPASITNCAGDAIPDVTASQDCGSGPADVTVNFAGAVTNAGCPTVVTRTNTATDGCGTLHTFVQTIYINCLPKCEITTSVNTAVAGTGGFTASVADAGPGASYYWTTNNAVITSGDGTPNVTWAAGSDPTKPATLCVRITTAAGCVAQCCTYIPLTPPCRCVVTFNAPTSFTNCAGETIPDVTASENCGGASVSVPVKLVGTVTSGTCPQIITRTYTATDDCQKVYTFVQTIYINCLPDCTITTSVNSAVAGTGGYTASVANAGPGATYYWTTNNAIITAGNGTASVTWTAGSDTTKPASICVSVTTAAGCVSQCCTYVKVVPPPCLANICGHVFADCDGSGDLTAGDVGLPKVAVSLLDSWNHVVSSITTDANGGYCFNNLSNGTYTVSVTPPSGYTQTAASTSYHWKDSYGRICWQENDGYIHCVSSGTECWWDKSNTCHWKDSYNRDCWKDNWGTVHCQPCSYQSCNAQTNNDKLSVCLTNCTSKTDVDFAYTGSKSCVAVCVSAPSYVKCGQTYTYTCTVTNTGNVCFNGGSVCHTVGTCGWYGWNNCTTVYDNCPPLSPGQTCTFTHKCTLNSWSCGSTVGCQSSVTCSGHTGYSSGQSICYSQCGW